jgi:hypothetical protein
MDNRLPLPVDINTAWRLAKPLHHLGLGVPPSQFLAEVVNNWLPFDWERVVPSTALLPSFALTRHTNGWVLWLRGIETWGQGVADLEGARSDAANVAGFNYAAAAWQVLLNSPWEPGDGIYLAAHSYGGMAAEILTGLPVFNVKNSVIQQHTYGAPRPAPPGLLSGVAPPRAFRWCFKGDIIPHVPPTIWELTLACLSIGIQEALRWQRQEQPRAGLFLDGEGHIDLYDLDTPLPATEVVSLIPALLAGSSLLGTQHAINTYVDALVAADTLIEPPSLMLVLSGAVEPPAPLSTIEFVAAAAAIAKTRPSLFSGGASLRVTVPKGHLAEVSRVLGEYAVVWEGQTIARFVKKSQANILKRDINTVVRRGQYSLILDVAAYLTAMNTYLSAATDPTSGFDPVPSPA